VTEMCVLCVLTLGDGDLVKSGSASTRVIVLGYDFHEQLVHFLPFAGRKLVHRFFFRFSLSLYCFGWARGTLLAVCTCAVTFLRLTRMTSLL
jgi:hypothetical protein